MTFRRLISDLINFLVFLSSSQVYPDHEDSYALRKGEKNIYDLQMEKIIPDDIKTQNII